MTEKATGDKKLTMKDKISPLFSRISPVLKRRSPAQSPIKESGEKTVEATLERPATANEPVQGKELINW